VTGPVRLVASANELISALAIAAESARTGILGKTLFLGILEFAFNDYGPQKPDSPLVGARRLFRRY